MIEVMNFLANIAIGTLDTTNQEEGLVVSVASAVSSTSSSTIIHTHTTTQATCYALSVGHDGNC